MIRLHENLNLTHVERHLRLDKEICNWTVTGSQIPNLEASIPATGQTQSRSTVKTCLTIIFQICTTAQLDFYRVHQ